MEWACKECLVRPVCKEACEEFLSNQQPTYILSHSPFSNMGCKRFYTGPFGCIVDRGVCLDCGGEVSPANLETVRIAYEREVSETVILIGRRGDFFEGG